MTQRSLLWKLQKISPELEKAGRAVQGAVTNALTAIVEATGQLIVENQANAES